MKRIAFLAIFLSVVMILSGCNVFQKTNNEESTVVIQPEDQTSNIDEQNNLTLVTSLIYPGVTLSEVLEIVSNKGESIGSRFSVIDPFFRAWSFDEETVLEIGFRPGSGSSLPFSVENCSTIHISEDETCYVMTEEEIAAYKEYLMTWEAVSAYLYVNNECTVLFSPYEGNEG